MDMQVDAQLIRNERLKRAWSQEQLAQVSGLGIRTVQRIENGSNASLETVKALAAVLELRVEALLTEGLVPSGLPPTVSPPRSRMFKPWRTFVAGFLASLATMGSFVVMQGAFAEQVDLDFVVRVDNEEVTRSRVAGDVDSPALVEVTDQVRIRITPTVKANDRVLLETQIFVFKDGAYELTSEPNIMTPSGQKALFRIGEEDESGKIKGIEVEITPMID